MAATLVLALLVLVALVSLACGYFWRASTIRPDPQLAADAARLPDAVARAERAEHAAQTAAEQAGALRAQLAGLQSTVEQLQAEAPTLRQAAEQARTELRGAQTQLAQVGAQRTSLEQQLGQTRAQLTAAQQDAQQARDDAAQAKVAQERAEAARRAAETAAAEIRTFVDQAQGKLRESFAAAADALLSAKAEQLAQGYQGNAATAKEQLMATLAPLTSQLGSLRERVEVLVSDSAKGQAELSGRITEFVTLHQGMVAATEDLTKALKGNAKVRGDWGELILETVLKHSGLEEDVHFVRQESTRDEDTGQARQPDVVVKLPDGRQVVVDSKVNLVAWADAMEADTLEGQQEALIRHAAALRLHMRELAEKDYPSTLGSTALELTLLFVPIEGALAAALSVNRDLQEEAFRRRVVFVSPNTLMATLRVIERMWSRDKIQRQVEIITEQSARLVDALSNFLADFDQLGGRLEAFSKAFAKTRSSLVESKQSVIARGQRLIAAGAKGKKALHASLVAEPEEIAPGLVLEAPTEGTDA